MKRRIHLLAVAALGLFLAYNSVARGFQQAGKHPAASAKTRGSSPQTAKKAAAVPVFTDVAGKLGLTASHISSPDMHYIMESMSGGIGLFDCDDDGRLDLVMVNGSNVERYRRGGDPLVTLWHQTPEGKFVDITKAAGLDQRGWGMGVAVADYDNDGRLDLYVTGFGGNALYRNLGDCRFENTTIKARVGGGGFSTGAAWGDYDRDGLVDLFVSRYVHIDMDHLPEFGSTQYCRYKNLPVQCGPWGLPGEGDLLYHNRGDGTFEEVAAKAGVEDAKGYYGLGAIWTDYDNDGWLDLFVADDATPSYLYHNNRNGTFTDVGMLSGIALSGEGVQQGRMGVDFGDYLHDGRLSLVETNFADQPNGLYRNLGEQGFQDVSLSSRVGQAAIPYLGWGAGFLDFDNSGWLGIFAVHGHVYPQVNQSDSGATFGQPMLLYANLHDGTLENVSKQAGLEAQPLKSRRGVAFGDIFGDGNVDMAILNLGKAPSVLRNTNTNGNHRLLLRLVGAKSNRAAIGARVTVKANGMTQVAEVHSGASYLSQNDLRLHFGLGAATRVEEIQVRWPNGNIESIQNLAADSIYTIVEGSGVRDTKALPQPKVTARTASAAHSP